VPGSIAGLTPPSANLFGTGTAAFAETQEQFSATFGRMTNNEFAAFTT
jgi:hypothetical protein